MNTHYKERPRMGRSFFLCGVPSGEHHLAGEWEGRQGAGCNVPQFS